MVDDSDIEQQPLGVISNSVNDVPQYVVSNGSEATFKETHPQTFLGKAGKRNLEPSREVFSGASHEMQSGRKKDVGKASVRHVSKGLAKSCGKGRVHKIHDTFSDDKAHGKGLVKKGHGKGPIHKKELQCQFTIGIDEEPKFRVVRRILGTAGANVKSIAESTNAKLRLRGRGSKFLEGPEQQESQDDLMLCISAQDPDGYESAKTQVTDLLQGIYNDYSKFHHKLGNKAGTLQIKLHEGYREGSR